MNIDEWHDIPGCNGRYQVTRLGEVRRTKIVRPDGSTLGEKILKPYLGNRGYFVFDIYPFTRKRLPMMLHRILAITFIPNPNGHPEVNHIDGCKTNNDLTNLEWCTHKHNMAHAHSSGLVPPRSLLKGDLSIASKLKSHQVSDIKKRIAKGDTEISISRDYNVCPSTIWHIKTGRTWASVQ